MIILRSPKGWTGPKEVDGKSTERTYRSHQVPMGDMRHPGHVKVLEEWLQSYRPRELFDETGKLRPELAELAPRGARRMGANPHANGGLLLRDLRLPDFRDYAVKISKPGSVSAEATRVQGELIRDVVKMNPENFRVFSPDETASNRWSAVFEVTNRCSTAEIISGDDHVAPDGRVMEVLSEHQCEGWLEGYLLTGRHGFFSCYEAFIHIIDSMFNQHAKWLDVANHVPWRRPIASLNYLLSSHVWRQDHNGFSHQDPGFIDHVMSKKAEIIRVYLPPDANTLLSVTDHCLRSRNYVNVIVAGKQPSPQWLDMDAAIKHCTAGLGIWEWASNDGSSEPDVVMACAGDVPTMETLAAVEMLRQHFPTLKVRVINVVDLMTLQSQSQHPHGLSDKDFDALFTRDKPIIFAYHGYPLLIHKLTYRRANHHNLHVHGFKEEGTTTTPLGLDQEFNSLDAQREACEAYIACQKAEGWVLVPDRYDDGGYSGGTLERPALQRLLVDIESRRVDIVVVYKIDRLSRSLMDFAKLVEAFDRNAVTFVSVTQSFNTTTSMGRLTLNILLSFAQFEREVIGERIRDKFAASRRKGMWMGGWAPYGYDIKDRKLIVNESEAKTVRWIFQRFARCGSALTVVGDLADKKIVNKYGKAISKGMLYKLLNNRVYIGDAVHKGTAYAGEHQPIIDRNLWDKVHAVLKESPRKRGAATRAQTPALLKGLLYGPTGAPMTPTHTRKGGRLYRYYISADILQKPSSACPIRRIPAGDIEAAVIGQLRILLTAPEIIARIYRTARQTDKTITEREVRDALFQFDELWDELFPAEQTRIVRLLIARIDVSESGLDILLRTDGLTTLFADIHGSEKLAARKVA